MKKCLNNDKHSFSEGYRKQILDIENIQMKTWEMIWWSEALCKYATDNDGSFKKRYTKNFRIGIESRFLRDPSHLSGQRHERHEFVVKKNNLTLRRWSRFLCSLSTRLSCACTFSRTCVFLFSISCSFACTIHHPTPSHFYIYRHSSSLQVWWSWCYSISIQDPVQF